MPMPTALLTTVVDGVFGYLLSAAAEESGWDERVRREIRTRLGRQSPEQMAFRLALERALKRLDDESPGGWASSGFDLHLLEKAESQRELAKLLTRKGAPDPNVLADVWAANIGVRKSSLREDARHAADVFLGLVNEELDAPDVRVALAPLRISRDLAHLREQNEALKELVDQVLDQVQRMDEQVTLLAAQVEILAEAGRRGWLRIEEQGVAVHGDIFQSTIITGDNVRIEMNLPAEWIETLLQASEMGKFASLQRKYLRWVLEQDWTTVSMSLFAPEEPRLGRRVKLGDIYTPLPIEFGLTLQFDDQRKLVDWWTGRLKEAEQESQAKALQSLREQERDVGKQRAWPEMNLKESDLRPLVALAEEETRENDKEEESVYWQADAWHAAWLQPRFVLVGNPGSGKSTFLRHLALAWANARLHHLGEPMKDEVWEALSHWEHIPTPIYVELRRLVEYFPSLPADPTTPYDLPRWTVLRDFLRMVLSLPEKEVTAEMLLDLLRKGEAALLLDGLDEVGQADDPRRRAQIQAFVQDVCSEFDTARVIVTSRPYAYRQSEWQLEGFGRTALAPLPRDRQSLMAHRLFRQLMPRQAEEETDAFVRALKRIPRDLSSNPLLLTLLAAIWLRRRPGERDLPSTRGELYRRGLDLLLEDWVRQKRRDFSIEADLNLTAEDLQLVLQLVAAQAQEKRQTVEEEPEITEGDIFIALRAIRRGDAADPLVDHLEGQAGILQELAERTPGALFSPFAKRFRFLHLSFQEYLTACEYLFRSEEERPHGLRILKEWRFPNGLKKKGAAGTPTVEQRPALCRGRVALPGTQGRRLGTAQRHLSVLPGGCVSISPRGRGRAVGPGNRGSGEVL